MKYRRTQAFLGGLAVIPLVTIIALALLSGLQAWRETGAAYIDALDQRYSALHRQATLSYSGTAFTVKNTGTTPIRLDKAIVFSNGSTAEISLNGTLLYPGENITVDTGLSIQDLYVITGDGDLIKAQILNEQEQVFYKQSRILEDTINVNYTGPFLGGYTVRLGSEGWDLLDSRGLVYYPSNWSFDSDDIALVTIEPYTSTVQSHVLQAYTHYIFDHGLMELNETISQGDYGGYRAYMGSDFFILSSGNREKVIDEGQVYSTYTPWYGKGSRIYTKITLTTPPTSSDLAFTIKIEDESGLISRTFTATKLVFWITYDPETSSEAVCWNSDFEPSQLNQAQGAVHVIWLSGNYLYGTAKHYYTANYVIDLDVETSNVWVEYKGENFTPPLSNDSETRLPIYSQNTSISVTIYYPAIVSLQTDRSSYNLTSWRAETLYVWSEGNGSLAAQYINGQVFYVDGSSLTTIPLQNAVARIQLVETIGQIVFTGLPKGSRLKVRGDTVLCTEPWVTVEVKGIPPTLIQAEIPLAVAETSNNIVVLNATLYSDPAGYVMVVTLPPGIDAEKLYVTVPPDASPLSPEASYYVNYGSWIQAVITDPPQGSLEIHFAHK